MKDATSIIASVIKALDAPTTQALENRFLRRAKLILTQGLLVTLSVVIVHFDVYRLCQNMLSEDESFWDSVDVGLSLSEDSCTSVLAEISRHSIDRKEILNNWTHIETMKICLASNGVEVEDDDVVRVNPEDGYRLDVTYGWDIYPVILAIVAIVPVLFGIFHFCHALWFVHHNKPSFVPNKEIEKCYEHSNKIPLLDTIFELKITWKHGSKFLLIINIVYLFFFQLNHL